MRNILWSVISKLDFVRRLYSGFYRKTVPFERYLKENKLAVYNIIKKEKIGNLVDKIINDNDIEKYIPQLDKYDISYRIQIYFYIISNLQFRRRYTLSKELHRYFIKACLSYFSEKGEVPTMLESILKINSKLFYGYAKSIFEELEYYIEKGNNEKVKTYIQSLYDKYYTIFKNNEDLLKMQWDFLMFVEKFSVTIERITFTICKVVIVVILAYIISQIMQLF